MVLQISEESIFLMLYVIKPGDIFIQIQDKELNEKQFYWITGYNTQ